MSRAIFLPNYSLKRGSFRKKFILLNKKLMSIGNVLLTNWRRSIRGLLRVSSSIDSNKYILGSADYINDSRKVLLTKRYLRLNHISVSRLATVSQVNKKIKKNKSEIFNIPNSGILFNFGNGFRRVVPLGKLSRVARKINTSLFGLNTIDVLGIKRLKKKWNYVLKTKKYITIRDSKIKKRGT